MTYRDDLDAARHRRVAISRQLDDVRARLDDRAALETEERRLAAQLFEATANIDHVRTRAQLPLLRDVTVASPCKESWASMKGDDRVRFCGRCEKSVFDLSEMTAVEAESVLATHGGAACVRFYRRADGTVMTSDCPEGQRRRRRRNILLAGALAAGTAVGAGALAFGGHEDRDEAEEHYEAVGGAVGHPGSTYDTQGIMGGTGAPPQQVYTPPSDIDAMLPDHPSLTDPNWEPNP